MESSAAPFEIRRQNPWWDEADWADRDASLSQLAISPLRWQPSVLDDVDCGKDLIYTLRGARQVGKTTCLKLLVRRLLKNRLLPPAGILYLDCERCGWQRHAQMIRHLRSHLASVRSGKSRLLLLLDEVTSVGDWSQALKVLADEGALVGVTVVATGSHAVDLKRGAERMPGRRGPGERLDKTLLPLSFREFLGAVDSKLVGTPPAADLGDRKAVFEGIEGSLRTAGLPAHFRDYMKTGGFPRAVAAFLELGKVPAYVYELYQQSILGTVQRLGHREAYFRELATFWLRSGPNPLDWRDVSRETDIGKHDTVREYVEDLELAYLWDVCYRSHTLGNPRPAFRSPKKIHIKDPFLLHALRAWVYGLADPWKASEELVSDGELAGPLVESMVASALKRAYGPFLFYWRNHKEVDLLGFRENRLEAAVEVKYQPEAPADAIRALSEIGGGFLLTARQARWDALSGVAVIPVWAFLAALP
jgi:predicted AAA+ superfamily ATPase